LEFLVQFDDFERDVIGEDTAGFSGAGVFTPDCFEFETGVIFDDALDVFDVARIEGGNDVVFDTHVFEEFGVVEGEGGED
jgi:hypothetical protein